MLSIFVVTKTPGRVGDHAVSACWKNLEVMMGVRISSFHTLTLQSPTVR